MWTAVRSQSSLEIDKDQPEIRWPANALMSDIVLRREYLDMNMNPDEPESLEASPILPHKR